MPTSMWPENRRCWQSPQGPAGQRPTGRRVSCDSRYKFSWEVRTNRACAPAAHGFVITVGNGHVRTCVVVRGRAEHDVDLAQAKSPGVVVARLHKLMPSLSCAAP